MDDAINSSKLLEILQICDSAFPTGGFSHSLGFESALKHKYVTDRGSFRRFIISCMENVGSKMLPFVTAAHSQFKSYDAIVKLDDKCQSYLSNHVENRACARQGKSLIGTSSETFNDVSFLSTLHGGVESGEMNGHLPVMFGALCGAMLFSKEITMSAFLYTALKSITASAVRLGYVGPMEAQGIQRDMQKSIPDLIHRCQDLGTDEVHTSLPVVDILQNMHDTLFTKLFYS